jgi:cytochrome b pre-mRNA-processing protein 3
MGVWSRLFRTRPQVAAGRALYNAAVAQARQPDLYRALGVPDTGEGRFELYTLHVVLLMRRLKRQGEAAGETSQAVFDAYLRALDDGLREMGVGDISVGKKMRKLGEAAYGRVKAFDEALDGHAQDPEALTALIGRTVYGGAEAPEAPKLAAYAARAAGALAAQPLERLLAGAVEWPEVCA